MSKRFTDEIQDIRGSFNGLKESFINNDIYDNEDEDEYDDESDDELGAHHIAQDIPLSSIRENVERRSSIFLALQTLFVLSFIHMDNFAFHIEGIIGLIVLALSVYKKKIHYPAKNMNVYILGILCLDAFLNTGFKDIEIMIATALLMYEQHQVSNILDSDKSISSDYQSNLRIKSGVALLFMLIMWIL